MFRFFIALFILVPIIEIAVFIQVGDILGLALTIFIVIVTAVLGVNLLKQQGFKAWRDIQLSMAQGNVPAIEMASGAQLLFAGGLLLTPGFVTDFIGFSLMIPQVRVFLAHKMLKNGVLSSTSSATYHTNQQNFDSQNDPHSTQKIHPGRIVEGEFEEKD